MSKHTTPKARREAGETLKAMMDQLGTCNLHLTLLERIGNDAVEFYINDDGNVVVGDSLDDAFIKLLHLHAGAEPPPF